MKAILLSGHVLRIPEPLPSGDRDTRKTLSKKLLCIGRFTEEQEVVEIMSYHKQPLLNNLMDATKATKAPPAGLLTKYVSVQWEFRQDQMSHLSLKCKAE